MLLMETLPGLELRETQRTTGFGLMEHPGITATGKVEHHMNLPLDLRTVLTNGMVMMENGMTDLAAL